MPRDLQEKRELQKCALSFLSLFAFHAGAKKPLSSPSHPRTPPFLEMRSVLFVSENGRQSALRVQSARLRTEPVFCPLLFPV